MDKNKIKAALIDLEEHTIEEAQINYNDYLAGSQLKHGEVVDIDDQSHYRASIEISEVMDKRLHEHEGHLKIINDISFGPTDIVKPGAVVSVNGRCLIVAIPKSKFTIDGQDFVGISTQAPIYKELEGKKAGYEFTFNGQNFTIDAVN
jgi:hypothetical protein